MPRLVRLLRGFCCLALLASALGQDVKDLPKIESESLAGRKVALPEAAAGKVAVLVIGFSKASKTPTNAWAKKVAADFGSRPAFELYQMAVLEDVPRLIRGIVISSIKSGVPESMRDHFLPVLHGEAELKKLVGYQEPDDAYMVVLNRSGKVVHQQHGALTDASYSELRGVIDPLLNQQN